MPIDILFQLLINGVLFGTMYGIAAIGLSLIFGTMRIVFIAQGTMIILAAYGSFWLFKLWGMDPYVSILFVVPTSVIVGIGFYQALFRKVAKAGQFPTLLIAFGLMALLENLMFVVFTGNSRALQTSYSTYALSIFGMNISFVRLMVFVMATISTAAVTLFLKKTLLGKAVRAASENLEYAMLVGITPHQVITITFALGAFFAGLCGALQAYYIFHVEPQGFYNLNWTIYPVLMCVLGGAGTLSGPIIGAIFLTTVFELAKYALPEIHPIFSGLLIIVAIMFLPKGLIGLRVVRMFHLTK